MLATLLCLMVFITALGVCTQPAVSAGFRNWLAAGPKLEQPARVREKWALLLAVPKCKDAALPKDHDAINNVVTLAKALSSPAGKFRGDHVRVIAGATATASGITSAFEDWLGKRALPDDLVFIYMTCPLAVSDDGELIACASDTTMDKLSDSGVHLRHLLAELKRQSQSKLILCALDTHPAAASSKADLGSLSSTGVSIMSATNGQEASLNNGVTLSSIFVHHLVESLELEAGKLSIDEAFKHIAKSVSSDAQLAFGTHQTPLLKLAEGSAIGLVPLGVSVKSSTQTAIPGFGHPMDRLAIDHPDIIAPHTIGIPTHKQSVIDQAPSQAAARDSEEKPAKDVDFGPYLAKMKQDIQSHWTPPKGLENRRVVAAFSIMHDGRIVDAHLVDGSGIAEIDKAALDALKAASPLSPLPEGAPESIQINYKFDWQVKPQ